LKFRDPKNKESTVSAKFEQVIVDDVVPEYMACCDCHLILACYSKNRNKRFSPGVRRVKKTSFTHKVIPPAEITN